MKPFFSIILPTYNQSNFLKKSLESIFNQSFKNWELIIIDNYSTDSTKKVINSYKDKRLRTFKINNKNILAKSRNLGIKKSKSDWICFIDSDDSWHPKKLEITKNFIEQTRGDLFYHDLEFSNKYFFFKHKKIQDKSKTITKPILKYFAKNGNGIGQSSVTVRKKILKKIGLISVKKDKFSWEDFDTWIRISKVSQNFIRIPKVLGSIYVGKENISTIERQIDNANNINKNYKNLFNKFLKTEDRKKKLWWLEYPSILKNFREKDIKNFSKKISNITKPPFSITCFIFLMFLFLEFTKIYLKIKTYCNKVILFKNSPKKRIYKNYDKISYKVIKNIRNLEKTKFNNFKIPFNFIQRIKYRDRFHFIYKKKFLISYGWSTNRKKFFISETQCYLKNKNNVIFYDFKTLKDFQNKGFYKTLLYFMLQKFSSKSCYIYSLSSNRKSISAILSVGFEPIKKLTFFSEKNSSIRLN